jgi:hypothetical protein
MRFAEKTRYLLVLAAVCLMWCASVEGFTVPRKVGNKWIYTDKTITIMQEHVDDDDVTWSGFTTHFEPETFAPETWHWDDSETWAQTANNWMAVVTTTAGKVVQFKNALHIPSEVTEMLKIPATDGMWWLTSIPSVPQVRFDVDTQTVAVPAGVFFCHKVTAKIETGTRTIRSNTWWADGIGIVRDSTHTIDSECPECEDFHLSKLVRYEFK